MEEQNKSVGQEFIEYGEKEWALRHFHTQSLLQEMAEKIDEIIDRRMSEFVMEIRKKH